MCEKVLIIGGTGFVGRPLVQQLVTNGYAVVVLHRKTSNLQELHLLAKRYPGLLDFAEGDILDCASLKQCVSRWPTIDCIMNLACNSAWDVVEDSTTYAIAVDGTKNVLEVAKIYNLHVIYVSSIAATGGSSTPGYYCNGLVNSCRDLHYANAKLAAELLVRNSINDTTTKCRYVIQPGEILGRDDWRLVTAGNVRGFAPSFMMEPIPYVDGGISVTSTKAVSKGLEGCLVLARRNASKNISESATFALGGENITVKEMARLVQIISGKTGWLVRIPKQLAKIGAEIGYHLHIIDFAPAAAKYGSRYWFIDSSDAVKKLGYTAPNAEDCIKETYKWLIEAGLVRCH